MIIMNDVFSVCRKEEIEAFSVAADLIERLILGLPFLLGVQLFGGRGWMDDSFNEMVGKVLDKVALNEKLKPNTRIDAHRRPVEEEEDYGGISSRLNELRLGHCFPPSSDNVGEDDVGPS